MRIDSQMPDTSYVAAHSHETHFEHSFPDGSPRSLFQEISLPVASAASRDKVEARRNDTYAACKKALATEKRIAFGVSSRQLTLNVREEPRNET